jgi:hypothetical protein
MRSAIINLTILVPSVLIFLCFLLAAVCIGIALAGGSFTFPWNW